VQLTVSEFLCWHYGHLHMAVVMYSFLNKNSKSGKNAMYVPNVASTEKCKRFVKLARKYDLLIVCDDVYNVLNYVTDSEDEEKFLFSPPRLFSYDVKNDEDYKGSLIADLVQSVVTQKNKIPKLRFCLFQRIVRFNGTSL